MTATPVPNRQKYFRPIFPREETCIRYWSKISLYPWTCSACILSWPSSPSCRRVLTFRRGGHPLQWFAEAQTWRQGHRFVRWAASIFLNRAYSENNLSLNSLKNLSQSHCAGRYAAPFWDESCYLRCRIWPAQTCMGKSPRLHHPVFLYGIYPLRY